MAKKRIVKIIKANMIFMSVLTAAVYGLKSANIILQYISGILGGIALGFILFINLNGWRQVKKSI